ncbi:MAG: hypothetical protein CMJ64_23785 [Planctomycetaceae bacterium]|nr:hypothetical protein [Planctomycetaceae bacterium]
MQKAFRVSMLIGVFLARMALGADESIEFTRDVAPIFEKNCLLCHKSGNAESDLSLATGEGLLESENVVPSDPEQSHLIALLTAAADKRPEMPKTGTPLTEKQLDVLRQWIREGAQWPDDIELPVLWSLAPLKQFVDGASSHVFSAGGPIDHFVSNRLREKGLEAAPMATRHELIRRLKYDLLGLPPTPNEIAAFVSDRREDAWERLVDGFLESPHYGERWAQHWLDVVRFSESNGFEDDAPRPHAWPYRDYVIRSFNEDKPYDQFVREQIAGDVLPPITHDSIIATSMLVNGPFDHAAAVSASKVEQLRAREVMLEELVTTVGQSILGLTVNCARCHDHKFDPIPQVDYYSIKAVFEGVHQADGSAFGARQILTPDEAVSWKQQQETLTVKEAALARLRERRAAIDDKENLPPLSHAVALWQFDGSGVVSGANRETDRIGGQSSIEAKWSARFGTPATSKIGAANSDQKVLDTGDGKLAQNADGGAGYAIIPSVDGSELIPTGPMSIFARVRYTGSFNGTDDVFRIGNRGNREQDTCGFEFVADGDGQKQSRARFVVTGHGPPQEVGVTLPAELELNTWYDLVGVFEPVNQSQGRITLSIANPNTGEVIDSPVSKEVSFGALSAAGGQNLLFFVAPSFENGPQPNAQMDVAAVWHHALSVEEVEWLSAQRASEIPESSPQPGIIQQLDDQIAAVEREVMLVRQQLEGVPMALVGIRKQPSATVVFKRGDVRDPGKPVSPAGLSAVKQLPSQLGMDETTEESERRRKFANWVTDPRNPLTARVVVNRVWHHHFGIGIVETPSDFGVNGGRPSHPELLDWLAAQFMANGWSLKKLHRRILTSATWRQSSEFDARAASVDANNRLLWRFAPRRLDAETTRDAMLFASGELNRRLGGPSFQPFTTTKFNTTFYHLFDKGEPEFNRRTIYRMHINTGRDPLLDALDCPAPSVLTPRRRQTITPLQALGLMNDTFVLRQARKLAERIERNETGPNQQVTAAWQRTLGRDPEAEEIAHAANVLRGSDLQTLCWVLFNSSEFLQVR